MTETTQLSGKIKHKCSKTMLLTPQELFELDRYIESLRASGSFTEDENVPSRRMIFPAGRRFPAACAHGSRKSITRSFSPRPTVPVDEAYLESSVFELSLEKMGARPRRSVSRSAHASSQTAAAVRTRSAFTSARARR